MVFNVFVTENSNLKGFVNEKFYEFNRCYEVTLKKGILGNDITDFQYVGGGYLKQDSSGTLAIFEVTKNGNTKFIYVRDVNSVQYKDKGNNNYKYSGLFENCKGITSIKVLCCDTSNITDMSSMFYKCSSLSSLQDISKWKTNNVTNMNDMFYGCSSLQDKDKDIINKFNNKF